MIKIHLFESINTQQFYQYFRYIDLPSLPNGETLTNTYNCIYKEVEDESNTLSHKRLLSIVSSER